MRSSLFNLACIGVVAGAISFGIGCQDPPTTIPLRSLERSGEVSFICVNGRTSAAPGRALDDCPDYNPHDDDGVPNELLALVTQTARGEVAVVNLSSGKVEDMDLGAPGFSFLPVGAQPTGIVSTPGGQATFVGSAEVGREAIFGLPSSCVSPPSAEQPPRDISSWPACALPVAPGTLKILVDGPAEDGSQRESCSGAASEDSASLQQQRLCPADLSSEATSPGRRKLLVTLPAWGEVWILDAQQVLDAEPGSFDYCQPEVAFKLSGQTPAEPPAQEIPADLTLTPEVLPYERTSWEPYPAGVDIQGDILYVADQGAPLVHRVDLSDICNPAQVDPLLPVRLDRPGSTVTTSQVAISPLTSTGKRFAYVTDELGGNVMAFDVSLGSTNRTPIVRERSKWMPFEPPDRIAFEAPVRAMQFIQRDTPILDGNGIGVGGQLCDPFDDGSLGAEYRPNGQQTAGARPGNLRGIFGMLALTSGQIAVMDVEDYDAPCRRPIQTNSGADPDFRGCAGDPSGGEFLTQDGTEAGAAKVTGEASCHVVDPHRARSSSMLISSSRTGIRAPSLRALPRLNQDGRTLPVGNDGDTANQPKLLATSFADGKRAEVFVAGRRMRAGDEVEPLPTEPGNATSNSVALITNAPRAFPVDEELSLAYEGALYQRPAGYLSADGSELRDSSGSFCRAGVQDRALASARGQAELGIAPEQSEVFGAQYGDYVLITQELLPKDDDYWRTELGGSCGGGGFNACQAIFGSTEQPTTSREFAITEAYGQSVKLTARENAAAHDTLKCCFPSAVEYEVRAGHQWVLSGSRTGFRHQVTTDDTSNRCVHDARDTLSKFKSRVYEVSCDNASNCAGIGNATRVSNAETGALVPDPNQIACLTSSSQAPNACVFENLTHRFVVYRGRQPSVRGMAFTWQVVGGFVPMSISLAAQSSAVNPLSMTLLPQTGELAVTDASTQGLLMVNLNSLSVSRVFY